jgi:hypothetical protein
MDKILECKVSIYQTSEWLEGVSKI